MGSVGSSVPRRVEPSVPAEADDGILQSAARLLGSQSSKSAKSAVSVSSVSVSLHKDIDEQLMAMERARVEFCKVEVYRQTLSTGVGEHHGLRYWHHSKFGFNIGLQIDWGQDGLSFHEVGEHGIEELEGKIVRSRVCGITPGTLLEQIRLLKSKEYHLIRWNCQQFCRHLFNQASGNWHLNVQLSFLEDMGTHFSSVCMYQQPSLKDEQPLQGLVYWYEEPLSENNESQPGIQVEWVPDGLTFRKIFESSADDPPARSCGLAPRVKQFARPACVGAVNARHVEDPPGTVVRWRECQLSPADLLKNLHDVEGKAYEAEAWSSQQFSEYMFERVLAKGGLQQLQEHLEDLSRRDLEFKGVQIVQLPVAEDSSALLLRYTLPAVSTIYLQLCFGQQGVIFAEMKQPAADAKLLVTKLPVRRARKSHIRVRLAPLELLRYIAEAEPSMLKNSEEFCMYVFSQVPGKDKHEQGLAETDPGVESEEEGAETLR